jgi:hypothetical protein
MMKLRILGAVCLAIAFATVSQAQTKISGTVVCAKPEVAASADVGDRPGHTMALQKGTCTWTKPMSIEGANTKEDASVWFAETTSTRMTGTGAIVGTLDNGDKMFVSVHDSTPLKNGQPGDGQGTFVFTGGTGKLKGIAGKGTYTLKFGADGTATAEVQGEYSMPAAKPASK